MQVKKLSGSNKPHQPFHGHQHIAQTAFLSTDTPSFASTFELFIGRLPFLGKFVL
jgi:hypothetical protein